MDPKQKDLTPEMKAIYERVMNTQVKGNTPPTAPPPASSTPPVVATTTTAVPATPVNPTPTPPTPEPTAAVQPHTIKESDGKPFVFSGGKVTEGHDKAKGSAKKLSPVVLLGGVLVFIVAYTAIWLKILGFF